MDLQLEANIQFIQNPASYWILVWQLLKKVWGLGGHLLTLLHPYSLHWCGLLVRLELLV